MANQSSAIKSVIFFEFIDEVELCIKLFGSDFLTRPDLLVVSLYPKVEVFLRKQGISYVNSINFFNNESHKNISQNVEAILQLILNPEMFSAWRDRAHTYEHFLGYHIKFYLNYMFAFLEILNQAYKQHNITNIYAFRRKDFIKPKAFLDNDERLLGDLAQEFCSKKGIQCTILEIGPIGSRKQMQSLFDSFVLGVARTYFCAYFNFKKRNLKSAKALFIVPTWGYKFDDLIVEIKKKNPEFRSVLVLEKSESIKRLVRLILMSLAPYFRFLKSYRLFDYVFPVDMLADERYYIKEKPAEFDSLDVIFKNPNCFQYDGIGVLEIVKRKYQKGLKIEMLELHSRLRWLISLFEEKKPQLVVSPFSTGFYYGLGELCGHRGIESCTITHGTHVPPNNPYEKIENYWLARGVILNDYKKVAVQSPWADRFLDYYKDARDRLYSGPLIFSKVKKTNSDVMKKNFGIDQTKKVILYASTQKTRYSNRFYITETMDEFIKSIEDIVIAMSGRNRLHLIIRPHPSCDLSESDFKSLLPQSTSFSICGTGKFENILSISDLLVSYSSTCIEEALTNNIPVVLYDRWARYNHLNIEGNFNKNSKIGAATYLTDREALGEFFEVFEKMEGSVKSELFLEHQYPQEYRKMFFNYTESCFQGGV